MFANKKKYIFLKLQFVIKPIIKIMKLPTQTMHRNLAKLLKILVKFWLLKISKKHIFFTFIWNIAFWIYIAKNKLLW
jgi:hypothetical protein